MPIPGDQLHVFLCFPKHASHSARYYKKNPPFDTEKLTFFATVKGNTVQSTFLCPMTAILKFGFCCNVYLPSK